MLTNNLLLTIIIFIVLVNFTTNFYLYPQSLKLEDRVKRLERLERSR